MEESTTNQEKDKLSEETEARREFTRRPLKSKTNERRKTETQTFIVCEGEQIETLFPAPVGYDVPKFQRCIGMAEGTILEANKKGNGFIEIDGVKYPMKENRANNMQRRFPLEKYVGKPVKVSFYPTITLKGMKMLKMTPDSAPFVKIANFRKEISKQGAVEALGTIKFINQENFVVAIWSPSSKKEYIVTIFGKCSAKQGDFVKVDAILKNGRIEVENIKVLNVPKNFNTREGGYNREGGYKPNYNREEGGYKSNYNREGGYKPNYNREEGGYKSNYNREGGYKSNYNREEGGYKSNYNREGGYKPNYNREDKDSNYNK
ncbi:MAG: hypothetical protein U0457_03085 [Candidatus Sericytochromatia bacterium]